MVEDDDEWGDSSLFFAMQGKEKKKNKDEVCSLLCFALVS